MDNKKKLEKQNKKREEKRKKIKQEKEKNIITKTKQKEMVDNANKAQEIKRMELLGLGVIFKVLHGRSVDETDKFTPRSIAKMCEDFLEKHKNMKQADKKEFFPLVALAKRKIDSYKKYKEMNKKLKKEEVEKRKKDLQK